MNNITSKIPSILYIPLMVGGIFLLIGGSMALFWAIATLEGFVSVIMLIIAFVAARASAKGSKYTNAKYKGSQFATAGIITFFALMGMAIDQTGNYFYNKPAEILWCDDSSKLSREAVVSNPLPGRTDVNQAYNCVDDAGKLVNTIGIGNILALRFIEYVFIAYFAIYTMKAYYMLMPSQKAQTPHKDKEEPKKSGPIITT